MNDRIIWIFLLTITSCEASAASFNLQDGLYLPLQGTAQDKFVCPAHEEIIGGDFFIVHGKGKLVETADYSCVVRSIDEDSDSDELVECKDNNSLEKRALPLNYSIKSNGDVSIASFSNKNIVLSEGNNNTIKEYSVRKCEITSEKLNIHLVNLRKSSFLIRFDENLDVNRIALPFLKLAEITSKFHPSKNENEIPKNSAFEMIESKNPFSGAVIPEIFTWEEDGNSSWEMHFSCTAENTVSIGFFGPRLHRLKSVEIGLKPNPINEFTSEKTQYSSQGDYAVIRPKVRMMHDHALVSGTWRGQEFGICPLSRIKRTSAAYCTSLDINSLVKNALGEHSDSALRVAKMHGRLYPNGIYEIKNWAEFDEVLFTIREGNSYQFSKRIYPSKSPFKEFFAACSNLNDRDILETNTGELIIPATALNAITNLKEAYNLFYEAEELKVFPPSTGK